MFLTKQITEAGYGLIESERKLDTYVNTIDACRVPIVLAERREQWQ